MKHIDLSGVQEAQEFQRVKPGGYICEITNVEDVPNKEYLHIEYDIADGEFKGYFRSSYENTGYWFGDLFKSYKTRALPFFKGFITAVEKSNPGYQWDCDESKLVGKKVGFVIGEEEYQTRSGDVRTRYYVASIHSTDVIRKGQFRVPEPKCLKARAPHPEAPAAPEAPTAPDTPHGECPFA